MKAVVALLAVSTVGAAGYFGAARPTLVAVILPAAALALFVAGFVLRVVSWGRSPVPFNITSVAGQQRSLGWLPHSALDSPANGREVALRLALDVLLFRSLFRNTRVKRGSGGRPVHTSERLLWAGALAFHYSLLVIVIRHLRFFLEPAPAVLSTVERWDGFFQLTAPTLFVTDVTVVAALLFLLGRRLLSAPLRYLSLPADYFPLLLILGVAGTGIYMRYFGKVDLLAVKQVSLGWATLHPTVPAGISAMFLAHLALVSTLLAYFPFSKLMHMGGIFLSPTRTLANDNRRRRHVNPWNPAVDAHTYEQWEDEFRDKLVAAGIEVDRPAGASTTAHLEHV